jgi:hypothetical protein
LEDVGVDDIKINRKEIWYGLNSSGSEWGLMPGSC